MSEPILKMLLFALLGASFASFGLGLGYRFVRFYEGTFASYKDILTKPSVCEGCFKRLGVLNLMPVFSALFIYVFRNKKAKCCGYELPAFHLIVELLAGLAFGILALNGQSIYLFCLLIFCAIFLALSFIDSQLLMVPDGLLLALLLCGASCALSADNPESPFSALTSAAISGLVAGGALFGLIWIVSLISKKQSAGSADYLALGAMAMASGLWTAFVGLYLASLVVLAHAIFKRKNGTKSLKNLKFPFLPYLLAGFMLALCGGDKIAFWIVYE